MESSPSQRDQTTQTCVRCLNKTKTQPAIRGIKPLTREYPHVDYRRMRFERQRFQSFTHAISYQRAKDFAIAGFFNLDGDIQCPFCYNIVEFLQLFYDPPEDPSKLHKRLFPRCPFVLGDNVGNVRPKYPSIFLIPRGTTYPCCYDEQNDCEY